MRSPGGAHGGRITGQKRFRQGHWGVGDGWELKPPPTISLMAFQSILIELSYAKCVFPRLNCRKAGISFGCPHLAGGGGKERIVGTAMLVPKRKIALDYLQSALSTVENREVAMLI